MFYYTFSVYLQIMMEKSQQEKQPQTMANLLVYKHIKNIVS